MRNHNGGSSPGELLKRLLNSRLRDAVKRRGRFIQNENRRILQEDPGNRNSLLLSARKKDSALSDVRLKPVRHRGNILRKLRLRGRLHHLFHRGIQPSVANVLCNASRKQENIL